jgi:hypothetical protein
MRVHLHLPDIGAGAMTDRMSPHAFNPLIYKNQLPKLA